MELNINEEVVSKFLKKCEYKEDNIKKVSYGLFDFVLRTTENCEVELSEDWREFLLEEHEEKYAKLLVEWCNESIKSAEDYYDNCPCESMEELVAEKRAMDNTIEKYTKILSLALTYIEDQPDAD